MAEAVQRKRRSGRAGRLARSRRRPARRRLARLRGARRGRWLGWGVRRAVGFVFAAVLLAALSAGLLHQRLRQGPISLGPQAAAWIAERMTSDEDGMKLGLGDAVFALGLDGQASGIRLLDVRLTGEEGTVLFNAPEVAAGFRLGDLLRGEALPTRLEIVGVSGRILRDAEGRFRLDPAAVAPSTPSGGGLSGLVDPLLAAERGEGPLRRLESIVARDVSLSLVEETTGRAWIAEGADLRLALGPTGQTVRASAVVRAQDPPAGLAAASDSPARIAVEVRRTTADGRFSADLRVADADLAGLSRALPELAPLAGVETSVAGRLSFAASADGALESFEGELALDGGRVSALPPRIGRFDAASVSLAWAAGDGALRLRRAEVDGPMGGAVLTGSLTPWETPAGEAPAGYALSLEAEQVRVAAEAGFADPLSFASAELDADLLLQERRLEVGRLSLRNEDLSLVANGALEAKEDGVAVTARLRSDGFSAETLVAHWPLQAAPGARRWLDRNLIAGQVDDVSAWIWSEPEAPVELTLDFSFKDLDGRIVSGLPPVLGARGVGRATLGRLDMLFDAGSATAPGAGPADLAGSSFSIPDFTADVPKGEARLLARSSIADALELLDQPPLELISRLDAELGEIRGDAEVEAKLSLPLLADVKVSQVSVVASARLSDVGLRAPGAGVRVEAETLSLEADTRRLSLSGAARIEGQAARISWTERYGGDSGRVVSVRSRVTGRTLDRLGLGEVVIRDGAVDAALRIDGTDRPRMTLTADLTDAALRVPPVAWAKQRGAEGRLEAEARIRRGGGIEVSRLDLSAPGLIAQGALRLDAEGGVEQARLSRLRLRQALDVGVEVDVTTEDGYAAKISGARIDFERMNRIRSALAEAFSPEGEEVDAAAARPVSADIEVARVVAADGIELRRARGRLTRRAGVTRGDLRGRVNGGGVARLRYRRGRQGDAVLTLRASDAGRLIDDLGLSDQATGGALVLRARIPDGDDAEIMGLASVDDIVLGGDGALRTIAVEAREGGIETREVSNGYAFDTIRAPFRLKGSRLEISGALAEGPSLGVKLGGAFDRESGALDFTGVLTPAYQINSLLNRIPVLGALLGGRGEGLVGLAFSVGGTRETPQVSVNPLSVLAPGVLRGLAVAGPDFELPPDLFGEGER